MGILHANVPSSSPSPLRRSARRVSDAPRPPTPSSAHKSKSTITTTTNNSSAGTGTSKQSPLALPNAARTKKSGPPTKDNPRKREPPPSSPRAARAEKRRRVDPTGVQASSQSPPTPVHTHTLRKRKMSTAVPAADPLPSPTASSSKRRKENTYKSPGRTGGEEKEGKDTRAGIRVLGCENPPVLGAKDQQVQGQDSGRRRSLRLSFPFTSTAGQALNHSSCKSGPSNPTPPPTSPLTRISPSPSDLQPQPPQPRKRGRPPKRLAGPPPSRTLVTSPPRPPAPALPPVSGTGVATTSPHNSPTSPTSSLPPSFLLPHQNQIHAPTPNKPSPFAEPRPLRRSTRLSLSISSEPAHISTGNEVKRPPTPRPPFEAAGIGASASKGRMIVREEGTSMATPTVSMGGKKTGSPLGLEVVAGDERVSISTPMPTPTAVFDWLVTPVTRALTPITIPAGPSPAVLGGDGCPECEAPAPTSEAKSTAKPKCEPELEFESWSSVEPGIPTSSGLVGPAVPPLTTMGTGLTPGEMEPVSLLTPTPPPPTLLTEPLSAMMKTEAEETPGTPHLPAAALPLPVPGRGQVPNLQIEIPEAGVGDYAMEVSMQMGYEGREEGQQGMDEGQNQGQEQHQSQHMAGGQGQVAWWEEPLHIEKEWTLWEVACRMRVWEIQKRYTPRTIRSVVAQEANDFYSTHGWRAPPHAHVHGHGRGHGDSPGGEGHSGDEEDWSEYESELSDEDDEDDEEEDTGIGGSRDEWGDDPDAEGEPDPEVFPPFDEDDPSFNAELSSPTRAFGAEDAGAGVGVGTGMMSAFYVPPSPVLDGMDSGLAERLADPEYGKDLALAVRSPETPGPVYGGGQVQVQEPLLPLPPPRLGSIRVHALRQMEIGLAPFVGRGTPVDRGRAAEWATGRARGVQRGEEARGRSRERNGWGGERWTGMGGGVGMELGLGDRKDALVLPRGDVGPGSSVGVGGNAGLGGGFGTDSGEWEAFLESLERDGGASVVASASVSGGTGAGGEGQMMDVDCLVGDGCAPMSMSMPMPISMQQNELMGPGLGMNMNMNMSMVGAGGGVGGGGGPGGVDGMGMFGMGFGVGMGIGMAVGLGVGVGGAGIGWFGPEDGGQQQQQQGQQSQHHNQHSQHQHQHPHSHQHQQQHPHQHHPHAHQLSPPVSPTSPVTPGFVLDGFDQPTSTLSFALG